MSATKNWLHDYTEAMTQAAEAIEAASAALDRLSAILYGPDGNPVMRVPSKDVWMLDSYLTDLRLAAAPVQCAKEPSKLTPILPGEDRAMLPY